MILNAYRYNIRLKNEQYNISNMFGKYPFEKKSILVTDFLIKLEKDIKYKFNDLDKDFVVYHIKNLDNRFFLLKFAKDHKTELYVEGEADIDKIKAPNFPPVYVIIDVNEHIVLIQYDQKAFSNTSSSAKALEVMLNNISIDYGYVVNVESINEKDSFWEIVKKYSEIIEVTFKFHSPNLFEGLLSFNEFAKFLNEKFNTSTTELTFKNEKDTLIFKKNEEDTLEILEYIDHGAGSWSAKVREDGRIVTKQDQEYSKRIIIDDNIEEQILDSSSKIRMELQLMSRAEIKNEKTNRENE